MGAIIKVYLNKEKTRFFSMITVGDWLDQGFPPGFVASSGKYPMPPTATFKTRKN
jgi:hypothetical protein